MSGTITPVDVFTASVPDIKNGDDGIEATFSQPLQALTNRTHNLNLTLTSRGVPRVRTVANQAALVALTGMTNGEHAIIKNQGLYEYDPSSGATIAPPFVLAAAGGGRWIFVGTTVVGAASGLAPLDASSKVPHANLRGHVVSSSSFSIAGQSGTVGTGGINVGSPSSQPLVAGHVWHFVGDVLMAKAFGSLAGQRFSFSLEVTQPDTVVRGVTASLHYSFDDTGNDVKSASISGRFVATQSGTHSVQAKMRANVASLSYVFFASTIETFVVAAP